VLDGLAIFVRRSILDKWGGWPQGKAISYWAYDYAICCEARRQGYRIRVVGVHCKHHASKSPSMIPENWDAAHQELYDEYRDVLPARVK
jgi:GT2 family glycosyltransferase